MEGRSKSLLDVFGLLVKTVSPFQACQKPSENRFCYALWKNIVLGKSKPYPCFKPYYNIFNDSTNWDLQLATQAEQIKLEQVGASNGI